LGRGDMGRLVWSLRRGRGIGGRWRRRCSPGEGGVHISRVILKHLMTQWLLIVMKIVNSACNTLKGKQKKKR